MRRRLGREQVSERRACRTLGQPRSTQRYRPKRPDMDRRLLREMRRLVANYPRYGSERVHEVLVGTGWRVNFKRVHRLWKLEHLQVPRKQRKRRRLPGRSANGCVRHRAK
ncbi:MAG: IS3 family transposase, partial [Phycisphaerae bacterium]|nr:IS3 family transposase [Phycisphaerae bacterium]